MKFLSNFSIRKRLAFLTVLSLFFVLAAGGVGYWHIHKIQQATESVNSHLIVPSLKLGAIIQNYQSARIALRDSYQLKTQKEREDMRGKLKGYQETVRNLFGELKNSFENPELALKVDEAMKQTEEYFVGIEGVLKMTDDGEAVAEILGALKKKAQKARNSQVELEKQVAALVIENQNRQSAEAKTALFMVLGTVSFGGVLALLVTYLISRSIVHPLRELNCEFRGISMGEGDLTKTLQVYGNDEMAEMAVDFNAFVKSLHDMVSSVKGTADDMSETSSGLKQTAAVIAHDSGLVSSKIESIAAASEEISAAGESLTSSCEGVSASSEKAHDSAVNGARIVTQLIASIQEVSEEVKLGADSMKQLGKRSEEIGEIVATIKEIADLTNLLALNAAIEAARAGDAGRGFAVVADEVRKLAERTKKATEEISSMVISIQGDTMSAVEKIHIGMDKVVVGVEFANQSKEALADIVVGNQQVNDQISSIVSTVREQNSALHEVAHSITVISQSADKNTHSADYAAKLANSLDSLMDNLQALSSRFKLWRLPCSVGKHPIGYGSYESTPPQEGVF